VRDHPVKVLSRVSLVTDIVQRGPDHSAAIQPGSSIAALIRKDAEPFSELQTVTIITDGDAISGQAPKRP
jgi:hypothetical protein